MAGPQGKVEIGDVFPCLVWLGSLGYLLVLVTWAVPRFEDVFRQAGAEPGALAAAAFGASRIARSGLGFTLLAAGALALSIRMALRRRASSFYLAATAVFLGSLPFVIVVVLAWMEVLGTVTKGGG